jgi:hypothetical protein
METLFTFDIVDSWSTDPNSSKPSEARRHTQFLVANGDIVHIRHSG